MVANKSLAKMSLRRAVIWITLVVVALVQTPAFAQVLEVKPGKRAIVKEEPKGDGKQFPERLEPGTRVKQIGDVPRYFEIELDDGRRGFSFKGNFIVVGEADGSGAPATDRDGLLARDDVLKIIVIDVEVGDAALIICPKEDGEQDVILIDTGENDQDRIEAELVKNGFELSDRPIDRMFISHYDHDHQGDAIELMPLVAVLFDHGNNNVDSPYETEADKLGANRRTITLDYHEQFTGGVEIECVAVNRATDFNPDRTPSNKENDNSIALIVSFDGFEYFTGGDLTFSAERSLTQGIRDCDVYHVNHHGSRATSSDLDFVTKLAPEVSIASNGTQHGHPTDDVAQRLIGIGSSFFQTNTNDDSRAHQPDPKFVGDDTLHADSEDENLEGATGTIVVVVDAVTDQYFVIMPGLDLGEGTFPIEN